MELAQILAARRSCRSYADRPVEREKITACIEAARVAPSGCNSQRWRFVAVDEPALRNRLAGCLTDAEMHVNTFAGRIPVLIALVKEPNPGLTDRQHTLLGGSTLWDIDVGIAAEHICLQATELGLGSVIMGWLREDAIKELLDIPADCMVPLVIGLGYPDGPPPQPRGRRELDQVLCWNGYRPREEV